MRADESAFAGEKTLCDVVQRHSCIEPIREFSVWTVVSEWSALVDSAVGGVRVEGVWRMRCIQQLPANNSTASVCRSLTLEASRQQCVNATWRGKARRVTSPQREM